MVFPVTGTPDGISPGVLVGRRSDGGVTVTTPTGPVGGLPSVPPLGTPTGGGVMVFPVTGTSDGTSPGFLVGTPPGCGTPVMTAIGFLGLPLLSLGGGGAGVVPSWLLNLW